MYSHPYSSNVSPDGSPIPGAPLAENRRATGTDAGMELQTTRGMTALLHRLHQSPEVRANVVAQAAAWLRSLELQASTEFNSRTHFTPSNQ